MSPQGCIIHVTVEVHNVMTEVQHVQQGCLASGYLRSNWTYGILCPCTTLLWLILANSAMLHRTGFDVEGHICQGNMLSWCLLNEEDTLCVWQRAHCGGQTSEITTLLLRKLFAYLFVCLLYRMSSVRELAVPCCLTTSQ